MAVSGAEVRKALWILALSVFVGFAAVYVIARTSDNVPADDRAEPSFRGEEGAQMAAFVKKAVPAALPDIAFEDASGKQVTLSSFKGKTVLLNLWATWCEPCREEMPALDRLQQSLGGDKFEVVALSLDRQGYAASRKFLDDLKVTSLKLFADPSMKQGLALKLVGMPTTILINRDGLEVGRMLGSAEWDSDDAKRLIEAASN